MSNTVRQRFWHLGGRACRVVILAAIMPWTGCGMRTPLGDENRHDAQAPSRDAKADGAGDASVDGSPDVPTLRLLAGGLGGPGVRDGTGAAARFLQPCGLATDGAGLLFVADTLNSAIRQVVVATGEVTTLAGWPGFSGGADGTGTAARFNAPTGLASDGSGNLFVADSNNRAIRKIVVATGTVTTLTVTGSAAPFLEPAGVVMVGSSDLYVTDHARHSIHRIDLATGGVTTVVGSPGNPGSTDGIGSDARFDSPYHLATDGAGSLLVADSGNHTIRRIELATARVTTLAGKAGSYGSVDGTGSAARFNFPRGLTADGTGGLLVADSLNGTIRKVMLATGEVTTLAGTPGASGTADGIGGAAQFDHPTAVALDGSGAAVFIADSFNSTIRRLVLASAAVATFLGAAPRPGTTDAVGSAARFNTPLGTVSDGAGNLFVADNGNHTIRKIVISTGAVTTLAGSPGEVGTSDGTGSTARFAGPDGLARDDSGNLFVADAGNHSIRQVAIATGAVTTVAGGAGQLGYVDGTGSAARFNHPISLVWDAAGDLYVADTANATIRKVVLASRTVSTLAGLVRTSGSADGIGSAARFNYPAGLATDGAGSLFVADSNNGVIRQIALATGEVTTLAGSAGGSGSADGTGASARFALPEGIVCDRAGNLFVADVGNLTIRKIAVATRAVTTVAGVVGRLGVVLGPLPGQLAGPAGLEALSSGELVITDRHEHAVLLVQL
jgi:sugar lactone lactonase YvrE